MKLTRKTQLNIGDCLYYKNPSNIHPCATYVAKVIGITSDIITLRMKPIESTMGESPYPHNISRTYNHSLAKNLIGTEGISLSLCSEFEIDNPEQEARLICERNDLIFVKMIGKYGFKYCTKGIDFTNLKYAGDTYEDDIRLFYMEDSWNITKAEAC